MGRSARTFLIIAWRNILRNGRRSLITVFAISFGLGAMLFLWGYIDGAHLQLKENFTGLFMGHIQIHARGFEKSRALAEIIRDPSPLETALKRQPDVAAFTPRVRTFAFFRTPENSAGGLLVGIDPLREQGVTKIASTIHSGTFLKAGQTGGLVLGASLAENLKVGLNGTVTAMTQGAGGGMKTGAYKVVGIMKTGVEELDKGMALITLEDAQALLGLGKGITDLVLRTGSLAHLDETVRVLAAQLPAEGLEIMTWAQIAPVLQQWVDFDEAFAYVFLLIVLVVIVAGILNTILMSMLQRTREFGVMLALGTKGLQLAFMAGAETFLLSLIGIIGGTALGLSAVAVFARVGVPISAGTKEALAAFFVSDVVYPVVEWNHVLSNGVIVLCSCILVSLYPAWRAFRLRPAKALYMG